MKNKRKRKSKSKNKKTNNKNDNNINNSDSESLYTNFIQNLKAELFNINKKIDDKFKYFENKINNLNLENNTEKENIEDEINISKEILNDDKNNNDKKNLKTDKKELNNSSKSKSVDSLISIKGSTRKLEEKTYYLEETNESFINTVKYLQNNELKYEIDSNEEDKIYELNKNDEVYLFIYKYTDRYNIRRLRCYDINCKGTAKLNSNGSVEIVNECNIKYNEHNYRLREIKWHKIKNNLVSKEEIKEYGMKNYIIYIDG